MRRTFVFLSTFLPLQLFSCSPCVRLAPNSWASLRPLVPSALRFLNRQGDSGRTHLSPRHPGQRVDRKLSLWRRKGHFLLLPALPTSQQLSGANPGILHSIQKNWKVKSALNLKQIVTGLVRKLLCLLKCCELCRLRSNRPEHVATNRPCASLMPEPGGLGAKSYSPRGGTAEILVLLLISTRALQIWETFRNVDFHLETFRNIEEQERL